MSDPFDIQWWRTQIMSLENYGYHVFLWRWWKRGELP